MKKFILILVVLLSTLVSEAYSLNKSTMVLLERNKIWEPQATFSVNDLNNSYTVNLLLNEKQFLLQAKKDELLLVFSLLILSVTVLAILFTYYRKINIENTPYK